MKGVLERLTAVRGVRAAALLTESGECLAFSGSGRGVAIAISSGDAIVGALSKSTAPFAARTQALIARFTEHTLVVRRSGNDLLMIVGDPELDIGPLGAALPIEVAMRLLVMKRRLARSVPPPAPSIAPTPVPARVPVPVPDLSPSTATSTSPSTSASPPDPTPATGIAAAPPSTRAPVPTDAASVPILVTEPMTESALDVVAAAAVEPGPRFVPAPEPSAMDLVFAENYDALSFDDELVAENDVTPKTTPPPALLEDEEEAPLTRPTLDRAPGY